MQAVRATTALVVAVLLGTLAACTTSTGGSAQPVGGQAQRTGGAESSGLATTRTGPQVYPSLGSLQPTGSSEPMPPTGPTQSGPSNQPTTAAQWVFTVVRHAERADDGTDDPPLTAAGDERAGRLANLLAPLHGVAVYATQYRRAQTTAMPTSVAWSVPVTTYNPADRPEAMLAQVTADHPSGAVLIVGHSDTVPAIVGALCGCSVDPIPEDQFGRLYQVSLDANRAVVDFVVRDSY